jgi:hypothetical protein
LFRPSQIGHNETMRSVAILMAIWFGLADLPLRAQQMLNIVIVEGEGAINNIRQRTARETIVEIDDENHKPVAGAVVTFTLPTQGAGGAFAGGAQTLTVMTDALGRAVATGLRVNRVAGNWNIRVNASFGSRTGSATIPQTNAAAAGAAGATGGSVISAKLILIVALVAGAAAAGGAIAATRGGGNSNNSAAIPTTITVGNGSVGSPH